jgi:hypothetical protein
MADLNLIPPDYIWQQHVRRVLWLFLYGIGGLIVLVIAARIALGAASNYEKSRAERLRTGEVLMQEKKIEYEALADRKEQLQLRLDMLVQLQGGPPAREMFTVIDRAINDSVWFTKLGFLRADEEDEKKPKGTPTGYFVVVPKEGTEAAQEKPAENTGHINIRGMALGHSALAEFVDELVAQPQIKSVRVKNTSSRKYLQTSVIEYELIAVMISDKAKT